MGKPNENKKKHFQSKCVSTTPHINVVEDVTVEVVFVLNWAFHNYSDSDSTMTSNCNGLKPSCSDRDY